MAVEVILWSIVIVGGQRPRHCFLYAGSGGSDPHQLEDANASIQCRTDDDDQPPILGY